ncbi:MAG: hypothetical protein GYA74_08400 [Acidobacteria bacterium]|jgi:hypothetical protein|nr:hypothetical protein [Acidobacteriota bacterium]OQB59269.1 MAG: hypothetical protein BWX98_00130 [Candidatus Aminicenantes bacterium ADurb.Bin147]HNQ79663.1 hypothetical protein [Candidatus Aminicenantes bacterium]HNT31758.1 hypothetical protein [Candidatus Aminicenantes bacterium]HOF82815.1 hypothetical protein [Candidatus Aminicenantes bacterium]
MSMTKDQEALYRRTLDDVKKQLDQLDEEVEIELQKVRLRLAELQESKKSLKKVYEGIANLLGIEMEKEADEDQAAAISKV